MANLKNCDTQTPNSSFIGTDIYIDLLQDKDS